MNSIQVTGLCHTYMPGSPFERQALYDVSFSVAQGEFLGIIGHTGSGKSTLIQHLNGLLKPDAGRVEICGRDIHQEPRALKKVRFEVGMVFQYPEYQLFEETVYRDIAFGPRNMGLEEGEVKRRVHGACEAVGLTRETLERSPFELSGGQKRRAAIAGVLAMEPKILVLDEPTAGLDPKARKSILHRICELHRTGDLSVLIVSHSMEDIAQYARRVLIMNQGRIVCDGAPADVFGRAQELADMGLSVPQASQVIQELADRGYSVDRRVCTAAEAADTLWALLREGDGRA